MFTKVFKICLINFKISNYMSLLYLVLLKLLVFLTLTWNQHLFYSNTLVSVTKLFLITFTLLLQTNIVQLYLAYFKKEESKCFPLFKLLFIFKYYISLLFYNEISRFCIVSAIGNIETNYY